MIVAKNAYLVYNVEHVTKTIKYKYTKNSQNYNSDRVKNQEKLVRVTNHMTMQGETVLLATALIKVKNVNNTWEYFRALIDPGSQAAFITEETAVLLGLPREKIRAEITGLGEDKPKYSNTKIRVECRARAPSAYSLNTELLVLPKLTKGSPEREISYDESYWKNVMLADPLFYKPGPVNILLGPKNTKRYC